jgi:carbon storage regulator
MRVLTRRIGQSLVIGDAVTITVRAVRGDRVRLTIEAPADVQVSRQEVIEELGAAAVQTLASVETRPTDATRAVKS